jgi:hypothetical protein
VRYVFCYVRPWNSDQFRFLSSQIAPSAEVISCSEHKAYDQSGVCAGYYSYLKKIKNVRGCNISWLDDQLIDDVIARCRLLRSLKRYEAERHLMAMALAIMDVYEKYRPVMVLSLTVDSYIMDLLRVYAQHKKIKFVALIGTFVNGYYRVSARGEATQNANADMAMVSTLRSELLRENYAPDFNVRSLKKPRRSVYRRWAANLARVPYFMLKRVLSRDYYNCHYWTSQVVSASQFHFFPPKDPGDPRWEDRIHTSTKPCLYIPLQMFPECTVDYWCQDVEVINYYVVLDKLVGALSEAFQMVVKEHPSVMGSRPSGFYTKLRRDQRVIVVPTYVSSNLVLGKVDGVVVWTGSVGFESMLRGKPVFGLAKPFYASGSRFMTIDPSPDIGKMLAHVEKCNCSSVTEQEQIAMLSHLVSQLYRGRFINDGTWSGLNRSHREQAEEIADSYLSGKYKAEKSIAR